MFTTDTETYIRELELHALDMQELAIITASFFIALGVILSMYLREWNRRKKAEMDERISAAYDISRELHSQVEHQSATIRQLSDLNVDLFRQQFASLDNISREYFEKKDSPALRESIIRDFEQEINRIKSEGNLASIEATVNRCCDNILDRLRAQLPKFKPSDIRFLALVIAGFSPRTVSLLMDLTLGNYYNKWTRLRARIEASSAPDKDKLLQIIENK